MTRMNIPWLLAALFGSAAVSLGGQGLLVVGAVCLVVSLLAGLAFVSGRTKGEPRGADRFVAIVPPVLTALAALAAWRATDLPWPALWALAAVPLVAWLLPWRIGKHQPELRGS
ncbi:hypothetical protein SAMN05445756_1575 [Kytococcus aerolatus]|uniref:Uncharacterized protein n=1 Tax=Kytococcus aerolatus TaxID=592308 RepID=A0A212U084_9MICO|nr:hypothetical protein [Kytococcus aerolatus]SNC71663.1 hypothetical protein SAMN05445756_1575 [Kytococcus aerolatus]